MYYLITSHLQLPLSIQLPASPLLTADPPKKTIKHQKENEAVGITRPD